MADDADAVVVRFVAATTQWEKQMAKILRDAEKMSKKVDDAINKPRSGGGGGQQFKQAEQGMKGASAAAANLSFQLNDIGTSLAGGASPFTVMMQQGSQVVQVMQQVKAQGGSMGQVIASAFTSMINPMALVANGLIFAAGMAVQYFTTSDEGAKKTDKVLTAHDEKIRALNEAWGFAKKGADEYGLSAEEAATGAGIARSIEETEKKLKGLREQFFQPGGWFTESLFEVDQDVLAQQPGFDQLQKNIQEAQTKLAEMSGLGVSEEQVKPLADDLAKLGAQMKSMELDAMGVASGFEAIQPQVEKLISDLQNSSPTAFTDFLKDVETMRLKGMFDGMPQAQRDAIDKAVKLGGEYAKHERILIDNREAQKNIRAELDGSAKAAEAVTAATKKMQEVSKRNLTDTQELEQAYHDALAAAKLLTNEEERRGVIMGASADYVAGKQRIEDSQALSSPSAGVEFLKTRAHGGPEGAIAQSLYRLDDAMVTGLVKLFQKLPESARITSGVRTFQEQAEIRARHERMPGGVKAHPAAPAGRSNHEEKFGPNSGAAVDIGEGVDMGALRAAVKLVPELEQLDVVRESLYQRDKVHVQLAGTARKVEKDRADAAVDASTKAAEKAEENSKAIQTYLASLDAQATLEARIAEIQMNSALTDEQKKTAIAVETELQKALNDAKERGVTLTDEQIALIRKQAAAAQESRNAVTTYTKEQNDQATELKNNWQQVGQLAQSAIGGLISDLRNGVEAGEAFSNMLTKIVDGLINMALQALFSQEVMKGLFGGLGGGTGTGLSFFPAAPAAPIFHKGGMVGRDGQSDGRRFAPGTWAGAERMHSGGVVGLKGGERAIIAQVGEVIVPRKGLAAMAAGGGGGGSNTTVQNSGSISIDMGQGGGVGADDPDNKQFGQNLQKLIRLEMVKESRPGGLLRRGR